MEPQIISNRPANKFIITREFDAPRKTVFDAWTKKESLVKWWGPKGFTMKSHDFDFRAGGAFHYQMTDNSGFIMWARFVYQEIVPPERIVFVLSFSDESGNIAKAPFFDGLWPRELLNVVTFTEKNGKTTIELRAEPINASDGEIQKFIEEMPSLNQGFGNTFDQFKAYLLEVY